MTTEDEARAVMKSCLLEVGFDFEQPRLDLAWKAFRRFAALPLAGLMTFTLGIDCEHYGDRDDVLWVSLARDLRKVGDEETPIMSYVGCCMKTTVPHELWDFGYSDWHWEEHESLEQWFQRVEGAEKFQRCAALGGWIWQDYAC